MRAGRIRGSTAHDVLHARNNKLPKSTILKLCMVSLQVNLPTLIWGKQNESTALQCYTKKIKENHFGLHISVTEIRLHEEFHVLGASEDGIATCKCHNKFSVQIKCPYKYREADSLLDYIKDPNICLHDNLMLKEKQGYMTQVQMQMIVYNAHICHFVVWKATFCYRIEVPYNKEFSKCVQKMCNLHRKFIYGGPQGISGHETVVGRPHELFFAPENFGKEDQLQPLTPAQLDGVSGGYEIEEQISEYQEYFQSLLHN
eukprot:gene17143-18866_t